MNINEKVVPVSRIPFSKNNDLATLRNSKPLVPFNTNVFIQTELVDSTKKLLPSHSTIWATDHQFAELFTLPKNSAEEWKGEPDEKRSRTLLVLEGSLTLTIKHGGNETQYKLFHKDDIKVIPAGYTFVLNDAQEDSKIFSVLAGGLNPDKIEKQVQELPALLIPNGEKIFEANIEKIYKTHASVDFMTTDKARRQGIDNNIHNGTSDVTQRIIFQPEYRKQGYNLDGKIAARLLEAKETTELDVHIHGKKEEGEGAQHMIYFRRGRGNVRIQEKDGLKIKTLIMKPGDIVIVQPNMIHQLGMEKGSQAIVFNTIGRNPKDPDYEHHTSFIMK